MNRQPMPMKSSTIATFMITMRPFTNADSFVPRISSSVRSNKMKSAGTFMMPYVPPGSCSNGECVH